MPMAGNEGVRTVMTGCLLADVPDRLQAERFDSLLEAAPVRIERIVSTGQAMPRGEWFDQEWDEWVVLVAGAAKIRLESEDAPRSLRPGDYIFIPAHLRHRVEWTTPERPTVWVAVHINPAPSTG